MGKNDLEMDIKAVAKNAWKHKIRAIMILFISILTALGVHISEPVKYGASMKVYMVQNATCRSSYMPNWVNSSEMLNGFVGYEEDDEKYNMAIKTSLVGKKFSVSPEPYGVDIKYYGSNQQETLEVLETLKYHLLLYAKIQNEVIEKIYTEYSLSLENKLDNGMYIKVGEPREISPLPKGSVVPVIMAGICIAVFLIMMCSYASYRREKIVE